MTRTIGGTVLVAAAFTLAVAAQAQTQGPSPGTAQPNQARAVQDLPEGCRTAAQKSPMGQMMQNMPMMQPGMMSAQDMPMAANMPRASRDYMEAMGRMNPPMMMAMMIDDPELAFLCSMIPHHRGAIDMARAVLGHTKDAELTKAAEKTIEEQEKEITELTKLVEKHAK